MTDLRTLITALFLLTSTLIFSQVPEENLMASVSGVDFNDIEIELHSSPFSGMVYVKTTRNIEAIEVVNENQKRVIYTDRGNELDLNSLEAGKYLIKVYFNEGQTTQWIEKS